MEYIDRIELEVSLLNQIHSDLEDAHNPTVFMAWISNFTDETLEEYFKLINTAVETEEYPLDDILHPSLSAESSIQVLDDEEDEQLIPDEIREESLEGAVPFRLFKHFLCEEENKWIIN